MVVRSTFYDTTPGQGVLETEWARSAQSRGATYGVIGFDSLRLTAHPTTPYAVNISPGSFFGQGVWDENLSDARVDCVAPAANATRWDLIVARRDWQPTGGGPTSFTAIRGGTTAAIPADRENRPGVVDDQPLWLVKWKGGKTQPEEIIDLRAWSGPGGVEAAHTLALSYLAEPGAAVKVGNVLHRYELQANNVWGWVEYPYRVNGATYTPVWSGFENRGATHISRGVYWVDGDRVTVKAMIQSGARPSLGLAAIGFSLPPGLPTGRDFVSIGTGVWSSQGTSGQMRQIVPVVGPGQTGATVWAERDPFVTPGRAGYGWGEGSSFHVQLEYRI